MICRHPRWRRVDDSYRKCQDCDVWLGRRRDPHDYTRDYYHRNRTIVDGVPQREWYWSIHKAIWDAMGVDLAVVKKTLEFGCGLGFLLWTIHRRYGALCVGVESSYWACEWQREAYGFNDRYNVIRADFEDIDANELRDENGKGFDFIFSCHVLEHLRDPMSVIEKCCDLLESSGIFLAVVPDKEHQMSLHVHQWVFDHACLSLWLNQVGFSTVDVLGVKPYNPPPAKGEYPGRYLYAIGRKT